MAEAEDRVRELGDDGRIYGDVVCLEGIDVRLHGPSERNSRTPSVGTASRSRELGRLEQALAVPFAVLDAIGEVCSCHHPLGGESWLVVAGLLLNDLLEMGDHAVVFGMKDVMHRSKSDVLVGAAIASHVVGIETLVGVFFGGIRAVEVAEADLGVAVRDFSIRQSVMRYVVEEGVPGADGT